MIGQDVRLRESDKVNHLLFMDDLELFGKHTFSTDIGMEFGIKECGVLVLNITWKNC